MPVDEMNGVSVAPAAQAKRPVTSALLTTAGLIAWVPIAFWLADRLTTRWAAPLEHFRGSVLRQAWLQNLLNGAIPSYWPYFFNEAMFFYLISPPVFWLIATTVRQRLSTGEMSKSTSIESGAGLTGWSASHLIGIFAVVAIAFGSFGVVFGTFEKEELLDTIMTTKLQFDALLRGHWTRWMPSMAFGVPHPLHPNLAYHPLALLFSVLPMDWALPIFRGCHIFIGELSMLLLCRQLRLTRLATAVAIATYLLCSCTVQYGIHEVGTSLLPMWSLLPLAVSLLLQYFESSNLNKTVRVLCAFIIVAAFMALNSHSGVFVSYAIFLIALAAAQWSASPQRALKLTGLVIGAILIVVICLPQFIPLMTETLRFPWGRMHPTGFDYDERYRHFFWQLFFRPLMIPKAEGGLYIYSTNSFLTDPFRIYMARNMEHWGAFFGPPLAVLAVIAGCSWRVRHPAKRALVIATVAALAGCFLDRSIFFVTVGQAAFRDPFVLGGILLGSIGLSALIDVDARRRPWFARGIVIAQLTFLTVGAAPMLLSTVTQTQYLTNSGHITTPNPRFFRDMLPTQEFVNRMLAEMGGKPGRLYEADCSIVPGALAFVGLNSVNPITKGASTDVFYPVTLRMYGDIEGEMSVVNDPNILNVFAIEYVLIGAGKDYPPGLIPLGQYDDCRLLRNPTAWPQAVLLSNDAVDFKVPRKAGASHTRLLDGDFSGVIPLRMNGRVDVLERRDDWVRLRVDPMPAPRTLMFSEMYRPGWSADSAGEALSVFPLFEGFVGITIPPRTSEITLQYLPRPLIQSEYGAAAVLMLLAVVATAASVI